MEPKMQTTLSADIRFDGVGLHTGKECGIVIRPAPAGAGVTFINNTDGHAIIQARPENVISAHHGTVLGDAKGKTVGTVEHLMAALAICGVHNAQIDVFGGEVPILDGSAAPFVDGITGVGVAIQGTAQSEIIIEEPISVKDGDREIVIKPHDGFSLDVSIAFEDCLIGRQSVKLKLNDRAALRRLARSRTFCRMHEVEYLRDAGLIKGGSLENSIVVDGAQVLNDGDLRDPEEFVLHKALDLIGDLYLLGAPIRGAIRAIKPGHDINTGMALALRQRYGVDHAGEKLRAVG